MPDKSDMIEVENVNHPGSVQRVDRPKYEAMKTAYLKAAPGAPPGLTIAEIRQAAAPAPVEGTLPRRGQGRLVGEGRPARPRGEGYPCPRNREPGPAVETNVTAPKR